MFYETQNLSLHNSIPTFNTPEKEHYSDALVSVLIFLYALNNINSRQAIKSSLFIAICSVL